MVPIDKAGGYCIFTFSEVDWEKYHIRDLIQEIKETVPNSFRSFDPESKNWHVRDEYLHVLADMFGRYFADPAQIDLFSE